MKNWIVVLFCFICAETVSAQEFKGAFVGSGWNLGFKRQQFPFGVTVSYTQREYKILNNGVNIRTVGSPEIPPNKNWMTIEHVQNKHKMQVVRLQPDVWVFPFLNIYAFAGKVYTEGKYDYSVKLPVYGGIVSYRDKSNGWEYGGGVKLEYAYKNLIPQAGYSLYWTALDGENDCQRSQEVAISMGYRLNVHRRALNSIVLRLGGVYNHLRVKSPLVRFFLPQKGMVKNDNDALLWLTIAARNRNINVEYEMNQVRFATDNDRQKFKDYVTAIETYGFTAMDFPMHITYLKNYSRWNMSAGLEVNMTPFLSAEFNSTFMENRTTYSVALSYRLFGRNKSM